MVLTHPHLFTQKNAHVVIELTGTHTRGMTVIDERDLREVKDGNCDVLMTVNAQEAFDVMTEAIAHFSY
jgi:inosine-uridine nucleoside N-ribohydrolase